MCFEGFPIGSLVHVFQLARLSRYSLHFTCFKSHSVVVILSACRSGPHQIWFFTTDGMYIYGWVRYKFTNLKCQAVSIHFIQNSSNLNYQCNMRSPFLSSTQIYTSCKKNNCAWNLQSPEVESESTKGLGAISRFFTLFGANTSLDIGIHMCLRLGEFLSTAWQLPFQQAVSC